MVRRIEKGERKVIDFGIMKFLRHCLEFNEDSKMDIQKRVGGEYSRILYPTELCKVLDIPMNEIIRDLHVSNKTLFITTTIAAKDEDDKRIQLTMQYRVKLKALCAYLLKEQYQFFTFHVCNCGSDYIKLLLKYTPNKYVGIIDFIRRMFGLSWRL